MQILGGAWTLRVGTLGPKQLSLHAVQVVFQNDTTPNPPLFLRRLLWIPAIRAVGRTSREGLAGCW